MRKALLLIFMNVVSIRLAAAQAAAPPPDVYSGSFGGGFALTGGNTDTKNFNLTFDMVRDPKTKNVIKATASYLRGSQSDVLTLDRSAFNIRDEYSFTNRVFAFGQVDYLRDQFKQIVFLWAPSGGLGYKLVRTDSTDLSIDGGLGGFFEKNPGRDVSRSGSLTAGQRLRHKLSPTAAFTQSLSTMWKTSDY